MRQGCLVLCFRNNRSTVSGCTVDFITPGVDDRLAIDVVDEGHQAVLEFVFPALAVAHTPSAVARARGPVRVGSWRTLPSRSVSEVKGDSDHRRLSGSAAS